MLSSAQFVAVASQDKVRLLPIRVTDKAGAASTAHVLAARIGQLVESLVQLGEDLPHDLDHGLGGLRFVDARMRLATRRSATMTNNCRCTKWSQTDRQAGEIALGLNSKNS